MELSGYVDDLQHRLAAAAEMGGEDARQLAQRLAAPLDAAVRLVLIEALAAAAGEISAELAPGSVDMRVRGRDPEFVVSSPMPVEAPATGTAAPARAGDVEQQVGDAVSGRLAAAGLDVEEGATTRTTLRLPDHLKTRVETAAAREGVSVNTWLVRAVAAALEPTTAAPARSEARRSNRITGWVH